MELQRQCGAKCLYIYKLKVINANGSKMKGKMKERKTFYLKLFAYTS